MSSDVKVHFKQLAPVAYGGGPLYVTVLLGTNNTKLLKIELDADDVRRAMQSGRSTGTCLDHTIGGRLVR